MAGDEGGEAKEANPMVGGEERVENQSLKMKEHTRDVPVHVGIVCLSLGGLGAYVTYRWCKRRRTEVRIRVLQERLKKLVEAEESASASGSSGAGPFNSSGS